LSDLACKGQVFFIAFDQAFLVAMQFFFVIDQVFARCYTIMFILWIIKKHISNVLQHN